MLSRLKSPARSLLLLSTTRLVPYARFSSSALTMAPTPWDPKATPYPSVRRDETFEEVFKSQKRGEVSVKDPYNWLHEPDSAETKEFVQKQGDFARAYLQQQPDGDKLKAAITDNYSYARC